MNTYSVIRSLYNDAMDAYVYRVYDEIMEKYRTGGRLLEIGCGTARLSKTHAEAFDAVDAFDNNQAIIDTAKADDVPKNVRLFTHDMRVGLNATYDMIIAPVDVFNHLENEFTFKRVIGMWMEALSDEGIMIFDVLKCAYLEALQGYEESFTHEGTTYQWHVRGGEAPCSVVHEVTREGEKGTHMERSYPGPYIATVLEPYAIIETIDLEERRIFVIKK